jgi:hypothetical protein
MATRTFRIAVIYATCVTLAICLVRELKRRGGPFFSAPATIAAHPWPGRNDIDDVTMLCKRARGFIPRGATVTVIRPSQAPNYEATLFLAAVANLPQHHVIAPRLGAEAGDGTPQYVIAVRESFADIRYEKSAEFPEGTLWMRKP